MNPIKAAMVEDLTDYRWSSYQQNALGQTDSLITEYPLYKAIAEESGQRNERYRELFDTLNITQQEKPITEATLRGEVYGNDEFHSKISQLISRPKKLSSHGGDRKSDVFKDQVG